MELRFGINFESFEYFEMIVIILCLWRMQFDQIVKEN